MQSQEEPHTQKSIRKRVRAEMSEREVVGGWTIIRGERRFVPLKSKAIPHCKSCLFFNKQYESCSKGHFTNSEADASICPDYINRTHRR